MVYVNAYEAKGSSILVKNKQGIHYMMCFMMCIGYKQKAKYFVNYSTQILCFISITNWVKLGWDNYIMKLQERKPKAGESDKEDEMQNV